ncbi:MAG: hypothetical protein IJ526_02725 [Lachnospiraceae bacterium]|nr:hypothetical protein [Lachnospiraceae bacterium]
MTKNEIICIELAAGRLDVVTALEDGKISVDGDIEKALVLSDALKATVNKIKEACNSIKACNI